MKFDPAAILNKILKSEVAKGAALLFIIQLILFSSIYFGNNIFSSSDTMSAVNANAPLKEYHQQTGEYPTWQPYIFSGMPAFESLTYTRYVYLTSEVLGLIVRTLHLPQMTGQLMHVFMAGLFTFLFMRRRGLSLTSSLFGGIVYMMNPYLITMIVFGHGSQAFSAAYIPLALFAVTELFKKPNLLNIGFVGAVVGIQLQSRHIQIAYYTWMLIGFYALFHLAAEYKDNKVFADIGKKFGFLLLALLLAFSLAAVLYLPVHEYSEFSTRGSGSGGGAGMDYATQWSFSPKEMLTFVNPSFLGFGGATYWGEMPFTDYPNYMGILALILAVYALIRSRNRLILFLGITSLIALTLSFGRHFSLFYSLFYEYLPFFNKFRVPAMILILVQMSVAVMGAHGLEAFGKDILKKVTGKKNKGKIEKSKDYLLYGIIAAVGIPILITLFKGSVQSSFAGIQRAGRGITAQQLPLLNAERFNLFFSDTWVVGLIVLAFLSVAYYLRGKSDKVMIIGIVAIGLTIFDLGRIDKKLIDGMDKRPAEFLDAENRATVLTKFLKARINNEGPARIFPAYNLFNTKDFAAQGIESIGGYHPAKLGIYQSFLETASFGKSFLQQYYKMDRTLGRQVLRDSSEQNRFAIEADLDILAMLNVKYILSPFGLAEPQFQLIRQFSQAETGYNFQLGLYEFKNSLPRAWLVEKYRTVNSDKDALSFIRTPGFDPRDEVVLVESPVTEPDTSANGNVIIKKVTPNGLTISVYSNAPAILVISEIYYPAGWKAFIDDEPTEILRANYMLRAVEVPKGNHMIVLESSPGGLGLGLILTISSYAILFGIFGFTYYRRRTTGNHGN